MPDTEEKFWTVKRAAAYLGISQQQAYELVAAGTWPSTRFGPKMIRIPVAEFLQTLEDNTQHATKEIPCKSKRTKRASP